MTITTAGNEPLLVSKKIVDTRIKRNVIPPTDAATPPE
jgi:hypothetical protein